MNDDQPSCSGTDVVCVLGASPVRKNAKGKLVCSRQKELVINIYKSQLLEHPDIKYKELVLKVSKLTGVGRTTIVKTISEYKKNGVLRSPNKTRNRDKVSDKVDKYDKYAVRRKIHNIWFKRQIPTLNKILASVNKDPKLPNFSRSTLHRLLNDLNFVHSKRGRNSGLIEKDEIVIGRNTYLEQIRKYRADGRAVYFLDETWVNAWDGPDKTTQSSRDSSQKKSAAKPSGKCKKRLISLDIGSEDGFVPGGLLAYESDDEMNERTFFDWIKGVLPLLKDNCVIVMDNAPHHNAKATAGPTLNWNKADIEKWLEKRGEVFEKPTIKVRLMEMVKRIKPTYDKYVVDEYVKEHNRVILRLPPDHSELNPMESAWSVVKDHVKMKNTTFELQDVHRLVRDGIGRCTPEMWKKFSRQTIKEENRLWEIDFVVDEVMENVCPTKTTNLGEASWDTDTDYDS